MRQSARVSTVRASQRSSRVVVRAASVAVSAPVVVKQQGAYTCQGTVRKVNEDRYDVKVSGGRRQSYVLLSYVCIAHALLRSWRFVVSLTCIKQVCKPSSVAMACCSSCASAVVPCAPSLSCTTLCYAGGFSLSQRQGRPICIRWSV
jgi:hypothetical protein